MIKRKNIYKIISFALCLVFLSSTFVYAKEETTAINHAETGVVDVELKEYKKTTDGKLVPWENGVTILPGMEISKIPRITNIGYDCYVRAKLDFSLDDLENTYYEIGENWIQAKDGYWYYTEILKSGEYTDIFQGIKIPDDFDQKYEEEKVQLKIDVDAIQAKNFAPNYDSDNPWGDVKIQTCTQNGNYKIQSLTVSNPKTFELQYDKGSKRLIKNEDDFFKNIPVLFPGDTYTDTLNLVNESSNPIKLYFHTYSKASDLLEQIKLKIVLKNGNNEKTIYDGNLNSTKLEKEMLLTQINGGKEQFLIYTIEVPKELDNEYTLLEDEVRWIFSVEEIDDGEIHTGDMSKADVALMVMIISGIALIISVKKMKKEYK